MLVMASKVTINNVSAIYHMVGCGGCMAARDRGHLAWVQDSFGGFWKQSQVANFHSDVFNRPALAPSLSVRKLSRFKLPRIFT